MLEGVTVRVHLSCDVGRAGKRSIELAGLCLEEIGDVGRLDGTRLVADGAHDIKLRALQPQLLV